MKPVTVKRAAEPDQKITYGPSLQKATTGLRKSTDSSALKVRQRKPPQLELPRSSGGRKRTEGASLQRGHVERKRKSEVVFRSSAGAPPGFDTRAANPPLPWFSGRAPRFAKPPDRLVQRTLGIAVVGPGFALADQSWSRSNRESCWIEICLSPAPKSAASTRSQPYAPGWRDCGCHAIVA